MNPWVVKSIERANRPGYLDDLYAVYPMGENPQRSIDPPLLNDIKEAYDSRDLPRLISALLRLERFPIKDSYIGFLRRNPDSTHINPKTMERLGKLLLELDLHVLIEQASQPKETNTQIGPLFGQWLVKLGHPFLPEDAFMAGSSCSFLKGSDKSLMNFCNRILGMKLRKGPDFILKIGQKHIVGEAKFLTDYGGNQSGQFKEAIDLLNESGRNVQTIAVLDGVLWIRSGNMMHESVKSQKGTAMSALLLNEYIKESGRF